MPTIKDIAKACDVSVATVSNIINHKSNVSEETRQRVLGVIEEMNYMPNSVAKNLKMKQTRSIGVIAEDMTVFALPDIIDGITEYCEQEEYQILLTNLRLYKKFGDRYYSDSSYKTLVHKEIRRLQAKQVDGIIYIGAHERLITVLPGDLDIPAVVAYGYTDNPAIPSVVVRDESGARMLTQYLLEKGHRKIGVIAGKKDSIHTQSRLEGFQKALFEQGVLYDPNLVMYGDWERECGYRYTDVLLEKGVTAIFCMNDFMAGGVYERLEEKDYRIGEDIAVVGFDNREMASYEKPGLTTMGIPLHDIGYCAGELIVEMLGQEKREREDSMIYVDCIPFIRESVNDINEEHS